MLNANHAALRDSFATQQFNFIFVEIELGLTFCQAARTTGRERSKTAKHKERQNGSCYGFENNHARQHLRSRGRDSEAAYGSTKS